ncbi:MAG TPA: acetyltransferase [Candidatus Binatia bacterium]|nr:acetyltransferase [Candidatus Binatia bacterium]
MLSLLLPPTLVALLSGAAIIGGVLLTFACLSPFILIKIVFAQVPPVRRACTEVLFAIARQWAAGNRGLYRLFYPVAWDVQLHGTLDPGRSYLVIANHQSIIDILLVYDQFHRRTPPLVYFLKRELLWMPVIGAACWAMDFPFMRRSKDPGLRSQDLETTRGFCERFRRQPITVVNFAEGTRFSQAKRRARGSPYRHLLRPKSAGLAYTLSAMGEQFGGIVDVTIAYRPSRYPVAWSFLLGEQNELAIHIDVVPVPAELLGGDYLDDSTFRARFQDWVNALWARKDARLERMIGRPAAAARARTT